MNYLSWTELGENDQIVIRDAYEELTDSQLAERIYRLVDEFEFEPLTADDLLRLGLLKSGVVS